MARRSGCCRSSPWSSPSERAASRLQVRLTWALCALLLFNAAIVATVRFHWETRASLTLRHQLRDLRDSGQEYEFSTRFFDDSAKERLTEAHVRFRDLGMPKLPKGHELESVVEGYPDRDPLPRRR